MSGKPNLTSALLAVVVFASGCHREREWQRDVGGSWPVAPVRMAKAQSDVARQLCRYLNAVVRQDTASAVVMRMENGKDEFKEHYAKLAVSGWSYDEEQSRIIRETKSPGGEYAVVTAALAFSGEGRVMLYRDDFFFSRKEGDWKILTSTHAVRKLDNERILQKSDYTNNMQPLDAKAGLKMAIELGNESLARLFLAFGVDVSSDVPDESGLLVSAIKRRDEKFVRLLLENGAAANINTTGTHQSTPLMTAIRQRHESIIKILLQSGADVNGRGVADSNVYSGDNENENWTPLIMAAEMGNERIVRLLLERGADVNAKSFTGQTAVLLAAENGHEEVVKMLIAQGADVRAKDNDGEDAFQKARFNDSVEGGKSKFAKIAALLAENSGDVAAKSEVFRNAFENEDEEMVCQLINRNSGLIKLLNSEGQTVLMEACDKGMAKVVRLLVQKGVEVNERDKRGGNALGYALQAQNDEIARYLLKNGAKPVKADMDLVEMLDEK